MKYAIILQLVILIAIVFIASSMVGLLKVQRRFNTNESLEQIIFKYDAELDTCEIDRDNYKETVTNMADLEYFNR